MWRLFLFPLFSLLAAPIGNPAAPALLEEGLFIPDTSWTSVQIGFTQDFLMEKLFRPSPSSPLQTISKASLKGSSQLAECTWNIREQLNLQLLFGPATFSWSWIQPNGKLEGESDTGFFSAANAHLILIEVKDTTLSAEGQIGHWTYATADISLNGTPQANSATPYFYYWQAGAALTQKIGPLAPYLGCTVNQTTFCAKHLSTPSARLRSLIIAGPFAGCTISNGAIASLNLEWRGWFEEGISLSCQLRF